MNDSTKTLVADSERSFDEGTTDASFAWTIKSLIGIFVQPIRTFELLRERPVFLGAAILLAASIVTFNILLVERAGFDNVMRARLEASPQTANLSEEQVQQVINSPMANVSRAITYFGNGLVVLIVLFVGSGLYLLGALAAGKMMKYKQALAVWSYADIPPVVLQVIANIVVLFVKPQSDLDPSKLGKFVRANPSIFMDTDAHPVIATAVSSLDLFPMYGLLLSVWGLRKVARLSTEGALVIVLAVWLLGVLGRMGLASLVGRPVG